MTIVLKNNVVGYLSVAVSASDTVLRLRTNDGLKFPFLEALQYCYVTLSSGTQGDAMEIVKVTYRMNDNLQVVRAQEDTIAQAFPVGAKVELRVTAQSIKDAIGEVDVTSNVEAAQAAATAAATSAASASTSADAAGSSAQAALTSSTNAETSYQAALSSAGQANTYANQASSSASNAAGSAAAASISSGTSAASSASAAGSATNAQNSANAAATSSGNASTSATQASQSASDALGSAASASLSSTTAAASAFNAAGSATNAGSSAASASTSATQASTSASNASGSASSASTSATNAANSATASGNSATASSTSASQAATSASDAAGSASSASTSATNAANSATASGNSATASSTSASQAATSATNAAGSASSASTSATNAANSATASGNSATASSTSASQAATSATNAAGSASSASTSATNAANSATASGNSATASSTSASQAATSATNAAGSASSASTSATNAANSATASGNSATASSTSASQAATSATNAAGSASSASTSATNAANSATASGNSASAASTSASNASTSATNAGVSASAAQTSATNAAGSASNAASSASTATTQASNASGSAASAASSATLSANYAKQGGVAYTVSDFVADGLFWTTAFGGSPTTVADPPAAFTYVDVASVGRVARVSLSAGDYYLQPKAVFQPVVGRKYRVRATAKVITDATGGGVLAVGFYINGLSSTFAHTDPSSDWTTTADGARPSFDSTFNVADGLVNFGIVFTCTAVSSGSAYWRPRFGMVRTGGAGGVIEVREFLIEEITDISTTNATITTLQQTVADGDSANATSITTLQSEYRTGSAFGANTCSDSNFDNIDAVWTNRYTQSGALATFGVVTSAGLRFLRRQNTGMTVGHQSNMAVGASYAMPCSVGDRLELSAYVSFTNQTSASLVADFFNSSDAYIGSQTAVNSMTNNARTGGFVTAPVNAVKVALDVVAYCSAATNEYQITQPYMRKVNATQTALSPYERSVDPGTTAAITTEANTRAAADSAAASTVTSLTSTVTSNDAAARKINRNLITNSTGLRGTTGWTSTASPGWGTYKHPIWGEWFSLVFTGLSGITESFYTDPIPAQAGYTYHFSAVPFLAGLSSGDARFVMAFYNSSYSWISEQNIWLNSGMSQLRQTSSAVAPAGTAYVRFVQQLINATGNAGYAEIGFWQAKIEVGGSTAWRADDELQNGLARLTVSEAAIVTEANTRAAADSAAASTVTTLTARTDSMDAAMNSNPNFSLYTTTPGVPDLWVSWATGESGTRVTGISPKPYAYRIVGVAANDRGIQQALPNKLTIGWHVLEYDVTLNSGTFQGAGGHLNWGPSGSINASTNLSFQNDPDTSGVAPGNGTTGRLYKFRKLINVNTACVEGNIYVMAHWGGLGSIAAANDITFHRAAIRPASQAEIEARQAKDDIDTPTTGLKARATSVESRVTTVETNKAEASTVTTLSATLSGQIAGSFQSINSSATFADNANATGIPTNWYDWGNANANSTRVTGIAPQPYAVRTVGIAGIEVGLGQGLLGRISTGWHVLEADITLNSGALTGAGVLINWDGGGQSIIFVSDTDINGSVIGTGTTGQLYKFRKLVQVVKGTTYNNLHPMTHWTGFGSVAAANDITWHRCAIRAASQAEIEARQAKNDLVTANAAIVTEATTRAAADSSLSSLITSLTAKVNVNSNRFPHPQPLDTTVPAGWAGSGLIIGTWQPLDGNFYFKPRNSGGSALTEWFYYDVDPPGGGAYMGGNQYTLSAVGYSSGVAGDSLQMRIELLDNSTGAIVDASPYVALGSYDVRVSTTTNYTGAESYLRRRVVFMRTWASTGSYQDMVFNYIKLEAGTVATAYTVEGASTTLQAGVTTNSSAIATVDGKLSASYGLTVDANGRIASMKLLSNGSTSEVAFRSDTFKVYNGASNDAVFEVSGGSVYIAALKVRTESMIANAVSQAYGNETDASYTVTTSYADIETVTVTVPTGAQVDIMWSFSLEGTATSLATDGGDCYIQILRDSTVIYSETRVAHVDPYDGVAEYYDGGVAALLDFSIVKQSVSHPAGMDFDTPSAGTYTYKLQIKKNSGTWFASKRRMNAVLRKK